MGRAGANHDAATCVASEAQVPQEGPLSASLPGSWCWASVMGHDTPTGGHPDFSSELKQRNTESLLSSAEVQLQA